ncbi:hypothetical protein BDV41DRAFT_523286 [Aspergillus transmontanensis]|uniref:Transmembrane protein n=1 Tax=Aspergillus transmontanensis TaxID=1034304 RepID=A0A5N6WCK2_9EURO|nr:hypothetical protein BDV41DRAFT_523286 [Aspergillus transmontanensis]
MNHDDESYLPMLIDPKKPVHLTASFLFSIFIINSIHILCVESRKVSSISFFFLFGKAHCRRSAAKRLCW